ncbi:hypothetical protein L3X38_020870 [Prunus dulcis]|uniref:CASP-like protein n=1 Tax=Prunus dulcis TaxID=3755 RepID=A0AAD4Z331_PRUDU|nr:hypothetical protein L3X38_020870 [Prunus dulcis]
MSYLGVGVSPGNVPVFGEVNGIIAAYSLVQVLRCVVSMVRGNVLFSKPIAWIIFSGDQVMAYVSGAAVGAAAQSAVFAQVGAVRAAMDEDMQYV